MRPYELHHLSKRAKCGGGKDNYRSARHEEDSSGNGPEDRIVCQTARIDRPGNEGSHRNQQGEEEKALVLTSASLRACYSQLLIDDFDSGLLEGTLCVSLSTQFGKTASLHDSRYDFNDAAILPGVGYWVALVERYLAN